MMRAFLLILYFWCASLFSFVIFFTSRHFAGEESAMNSGVIDFWWNWDSAPWLFERIS